MNKIATSNLGLIVTEKCNLNCAHCLQGKATDKKMSDKVIEATLSQFCHIENLAICGGEPTLALDRLEKIFSYVISNGILVDRVSITINGTVYSEDFLRLLGYIDDYINHKGEMRGKTNFTISYDKFHVDELVRLKLIERYKQNVMKYQQSLFFAGFQKLGDKVISEGNAQSLDSSITVPLKPYQFLMTYVGKNRKLDSNNVLCYIGPYVAVNVDGIVTECDASNEHQISLYNYGNVLNESVEEICLRSHARILKPWRWPYEVNMQIIRRSRM